SVAVHSTDVNAREVVTPPPNRAPLPVRCAADEDHVCIGRHVLGGHPVLNSEGEGETERPELRLPFTPASDRCVSVGYHIRYEQPAGRGHLVHRNLPAN